MSETAWAIREEIPKLLDQEKANEDRFRGQYKENWDRTPSNDINANYYRDLESVTNYLNQGKDADSRVSTLLANSQESLNYVSKPVREIESTLPKLDVSAKTESSEEVRSILRELTALLKRREQLIDGFINEVDSFDPTNNVMANKHSASVVDILKDQKSYFESSRKAIDANLAQQSELLDRLVSANAEFVKSQAPSDVSDARRRCLQLINQGTTAFEKLDRNISEGVSFYTDIIGEYLRPLKDSVLGYVTARDQEARLLLSDISRAFAATSLTDRQPMPSMPFSDDTFDNSPADNTSSFHPSAPPF